MTPRLAVTREQADSVRQMARQQREDRELVARSGLSGVMLRSLTLRLPERPTMPCLICRGRRFYSKPIASVSGVHMGQITCRHCGAQGVVPIPEGTRVEVGWWAGLYLGQEDWRNEWRPVAFATLTEVHAALADGQPYRWYITLSDIEPAGEDQ